MYPSPATRFGARDGENEEAYRFSSSHFATAACNVGGVGDTGRNIGADLSPHYASNHNHGEAMELSPHGDDTNRGWDATNRTESPGNCRSPNVDAYDNDLRRRSPDEDSDDGDGRGVPRPRRRLALDRVSSSRREQHEYDTAAQMRRDDSVPNCVSIETGGSAGLRGDFSSADYYNDANVDNVGVYAAPLSTFSRNYSDRDRNQDQDQDSWAATGVDVAAAGVLYGTAAGAREANGRACDEHLGGNPLDTHEEASQIDYLGSGERVGFVAEAPVLGREMWSPPPAPRPPRGGFGYGSMPTRLRSVRSNGCTDRHTRGRGRRGEREGNPHSRIARGNPPARGEWLRHLPGLATDGEAVRESSRNPPPTSAAAAAVEGVNERSLSRLFEYAFTDGGQSRSSQRPMNGDRESGNRRDETCGSGGAGYDGRGGGSRGGATIFPGRKWTEGRKTSYTVGGFNGVFSRSRPCSVPLLSLEEEAGACLDETSAPSRQPVVGATVRRPPSPQFDFFPAETEVRGSTVGSSSRTRDKNRREQPHSPPVLRRKQEADRDEVLVAADGVQGKSRRPGHETHGSDSSNSNPVGSEPLLLERKREGFSRFAPPQSDADTVSEIFGEDRRVDDGHLPMSAAWTQATASHRSDRTGTEKDASHRASTSPRALFSRKRARATTEACIEDASAVGSSSWPPALPPPERRQGRHSPPVLESSTRASSSSSCSNNKHETAVARPPSRDSHGVPEGDIQASIRRTEAQEEPKEEEDEEEEQAGVALGNGWLGGWSASPPRREQGWWGGECPTGSGRESPRNLAGGALNETGGGGGDGVGSTAAMLQVVEPSAEASVAPEETDGEPRVRGGWERRGSLEISGECERVTRREGDGESEGGSRLASGDEQPAVAAAAMQHQAVGGVSHASKPVEGQGARGLQSSENSERGGTHSEDRRRRSQKHETRALPEVEDAASVDAPLLETFSGGTGQTPGCSSSIGRCNSNQDREESGSGVGGEEGLVRRAMNNLRQTADVALAYDLDVLGGDGLGLCGVAATAAAEFDEEELSDIVGGAMLESFLPAEACDRCAMWCDAMDDDKFQFWFY